jgi:hypothetical protein
VTAVGTESTRGAAMRLQTEKIGVSRRAAWAILWQGLGRVRQQLRCSSFSAAPVQGRKPNKWPVRGEIRKNPVIFFWGSSRTRGCTEELVADSEMGRRPMSESATNSSVHPREARLSFRFREREESEIIIIIREIV